MKLDVRPRATVRAAARNHDDRVSWDSGDVGTAPRRIHPLLIALVVAGVAVLGWLTRTTGTMTDDPEQAFAIERSTEPLDFADDEAEQAAPAIGSGGPMVWGRLPDAPFDTVVGSPVVAVGSSVITVGYKADMLLLGRADLTRLSGVGGIEERAAERWTVLPASPLSTRSAPLLARVGPERFLVWGGTAGADGTGALLHDGAILDLGTGRWKKLPPLPALESPRTAAWVDSRLLVVGMEDGAPAAYSWTLDRNGWHRPPAPPVETMTSVESIGTGTNFMVYGARTGQGQMRTEVFTLGYDTQEERWREYHIVALQHPDEVAVVATTPDEILMWGRPSTNDASLVPDGLTVNLETQAWSQLPTAPVHGTGGRPTALVRPVDLSAAWTGQTVIIAASSFTDMLVYRPETEGWATLPPIVGPTGGQLAWTNDRVVRWGGRVGGQPVPQLWVLPGDRPWSLRR